MKSAPEVPKKMFGASLPVRGAWVEMLHIVGAVLANQSLPVRGAWVEIARVFPVRCW